MKITRLQLVCSISGYNSQNHILHQEIKIILSQVRIRKKSFVSVAVIKQLQAKQKYGLAFYQPNLHFVLKKFCVSSMQFTKFDYERKVGHKYLSVCSYGGTHKKVSEERDKSKS